MTISIESKNFFAKLSMVWQNFKDYTYFEGINLSQEQINIIEHDSDQLLIEGYAGTGKSLTLLYKFINVLVQQDGKRILYVTFNKTLIDDTKKRLNECREYLENKDKHFTRIATFHGIATELLKENKIIASGVSSPTVDIVNNYQGNKYRYIAAIASKYKETDKEEYKNLKPEERLYKTHDTNFIVDEITWIKAMGFIKIEKYLETERTGRSKSIRLTRTQRNTIFRIFEDYREKLKSEHYNYLDLEDYALKLIENIRIFDEEKKFDYIFVDEVQDLDPMQILALTLLTKKSIILSGDAKQRIYKKSPIKYEDIGLHIREKGKRKILNKNYRSTAQIVKLANDLVFFDNEEKLMEKQFVREGIRPSIYFADNKKALKYISNTIKRIHNEDERKTIAIIHREDVKPKLCNGKSDFRLFLEKESLTTFTDINTYGKKFDYKQKKQIFYTNAYDIKGLEFDVVFIIDFNNRYYPNSKEVDKIKSNNEGKDINLINEDITDFINREKKLLYVAMTRAKEELYLIANGCTTENEISNFIFDFNSQNYKAENFTKKEIEKLKVHHNMRMKRLLGDKYIKFYEIERDRNEKNRVENKDDIVKEKLLEENNWDKIVPKDEIQVEDNSIRQQVTFKDVEIEEVDIKNNNIIVNENKSNNQKTDLDSNKDFINYFKSKGIEVVDKREKGRVLCVVAGMEISDVMKQLATKRIYFKFFKNGDKTSKHRAAWYLVSARKE